MPFFNFNNIKIAAVATAVPSQVVTVDSFADTFGEEYVKKFQESTGIRQFHKTLPHQTASDLCFAAAENILNSKNIDRDEIGVLIFIAHSTDYRRPATACVLHKRLNLKKDCAAFDISLGCSAFVYGIQVAASMLASSNSKKALVLCGETLTKMVYPEDKAVAMLFGDGGSAALLEKVETPSEIKGLLKSDGTGYRAIIAPAGGFRNMDGPKDVFTWHDGNKRTLYNTVMLGEDVFAFTISDVAKTVKEFLKDTDTTPDDYDCLAFHQANQSIQKMLCKKLKVDTAKMPLCLDRYGNPSAPAIPLVLCDVYGNDEEAKDLKFLMCGFGVGLSWGVCSATINTGDILPVIETDVIFEEGIINKPEELFK